jgi:hypothetical protein
VAEEADWEEDMDDCAAVPTVLMAQLVISSEKHITTVIRAEIGLIVFFIFIPPCL